jgi:hypothetical protein
MSDKAGAMNHHLADRTRRNLTGRVRRNLFPPGATLAQSLKGIAGFVVGWGTVIGLLIWGGYHQGYLRGPVAGVVLGGILFGLAILYSPDWRQPVGPPGPHGRQGPYPN